MADGHMVFKQGAKEIAEQHGKALSFMPKILASEAGNSCHIHISIAKGGDNLFWDAKAKQPSKYFRQFLGGVHAGDTALQCAHFGRQPRCRNLDVRSGLREVPG